MVEVATDQDFINLALVSVVPTSSVQREGRQWKKGLGQKGNGHAEPLRLCLGAACDCTAKVFVAYSSAKTHIAGE